MGRVKLTKNEVLYTYQKLSRMSAEKGNAKLYLKELSGCGIPFYGPVLFAAKKLNLIVNFSNNTCAFKTNYDLEALYKETKKLRDKQVKSCKERRVKRNNLKSNTNTIKSSSRLQNTSSKKELLENCRIETIFSELKRRGYSGELTKKINI